MLLFTRNASYISCFLSTFIEKPLGIVRDQIVLALLAFLAIDSLIERHELLSNIEKKISYIEKQVSLKNFHKGLLKQRKDEPKSEKLIQDAIQELWASSFMLGSIVTAIDNLLNEGILKTKLDNGFKIRILTIDPYNDEVVKDTSKYFGIENLREQVIINLTRLYNELKLLFPNQVEIKVIDNRPSVGYFITDPNLDPIGNLSSNTGLLIVDSYIYKRTKGDISPMLMLSKRKDFTWF